MTDFTEGTNPDNSGFNFRELLEAVEALSKIPETFRISYLLSLLGMQPFLIAGIRGISEKEVKRQLSEVDDLLHRHIEDVVDSYLSRQDKEEDSPDSSQGLDAEIERLFSHMPIGANFAYRAFQQFGSWDRAQKELGYDRQTMTFFLDTARQKFYGYMEGVVRRLLDYLLETDQTDCPEPLQKARDLALEAKALNDFVVDADELLDVNEKNPGLGQLTPAEKVEADNILFSMAVLDREAFALHHLTPLSPEEIASQLHLSESDFAVRLQSLQDRLYRWMEELLIGVAWRMEHWPNRPEMTNTQRKVARIAWRNLPPKCQEIVRLHFLLRKSTQEIAQETGDERESVVEMIETTRQRIAHYGESLVTGWLRSALGDLTDPYEIRVALETDTFLSIDDRRAAVKEKYPITEQERSYAETVIGKMEAYQRVVFQLAAVRFSIDEVSTLMHVEEKELRLILRDVRDMLGKQLERLVIGLFLNRTKKPYAPRMKREEFKVAKSVLNVIPARGRQAFAHFMATGSSQTEVAEMLGMTIEQFSSLIEQTQQTIRRRAVRAGIASVLQGESPEEAKERVFTKIRREVVSREGLDTIKAEPKPRKSAPAKLTDSLRHEATLAWSHLNPQQQEIMALCKGEDMEESEVAHLLQLSVPEIREQIRTIREEWREFVLRSILGMLQIRENRPDPIPVTETAMETAEWVYKIVSEKSRLAFERSLLTGDSIEETAEQLGITPEEAATRIDDANFYIGVHIELLMLTWLREEENGQTRAKHFLAEVRKGIATETPIEEIAPAPETRYIRAEADEIARIIKQMDFEVREAFVLAVGAVVKPQEIAKIQKSDVQTVQQRVKEGVETVIQNMERLMVAWLRRRSKQPGAPQLKLGEKMTAKAAFKQIPEKSRKAYILDRVEGKSIKEISEQMRLSIEEVEHRLEEADLAIFKRVIDLSGCTLRVVEHGRVVGETLIGSPKDIRFSPDVWRKYGIGILAEDMLTETPVAEAPEEKIPIAEVPPENPTYETIPEKDPQAEPSRHVMASYAGLGFGMSQMGEWLTATVKTVLTTIAATGFMVLAAPFLWVMSLLISGQVSGFAFIRTAPTLEARRWLTEKLFYLYSLLFVGPLFTWLVIIKLRITNAYLWKTLFVSSWVLLLFLIAIVAFQIARFYNRFCILQNQRQYTQCGLRKLHFIINFGFSIHALIISQLLWENAKDVFSMLFGQTVDSQIVFFLLLTISIGVTHISAYFMFRFFLNISKDDVAFQKTPPIVVAENTNIASIKIIEFLRILPFALFPILANLLHIIIAREHGLRSSIELVVFLTWWSIVWRRNTQKEKGKWWRILVSFVGQFAAMYILRIYLF